MFGASRDNKRLLTALLESDAASLREKMDREISKAFGSGPRLPTLKTAGLRAALLYAELDVVAAGIR